MINSDCLRLDLACKWNDFSYLRNATFSPTRLKVALLRKSSAEIWKSHSIHNPALDSGH